VRGSGERHAPVVYSEVMSIRNRKEAHHFLHAKTGNDRLIKHMLAVEAVLRALAEKLGENPDRWGMAGLLHDVDYAMNTDASGSGRPENQGGKLVHSLESVFAGVVDDELLHVMQSHDPEHTGITPESRWEKALYVADPVTGFIVAAALVQPDKKLASVEVRSLLKKFKAKEFARGASREQMMRCEELGLSLEEFLALSLRAMQQIHADLGL
jgi:putative nucleotidyltransferase with HDIG domain